jgi:hypothetical protein
VQIEPRIGPSFLHWFGSYPGPLSSVTWCP